MKRYSVQTGWKNRGRTPDLQGNISVIAINRQVADLAVLVDYVDLGETVQEISANDPVSLSMMPDIKHPYMCGSKNLIPN